MVVLSLNRSVFLMSPICLPVPVPSLLVSMEGVDELLGCVLGGGTVLAEEDPSS